MLTNKKLDKVEKILGKDVLDSLADGTADELKVTLVQAEQAITKAQEELEANPKYQDLKDSLKEISAALKDCKKFQRAKIAYILHLLETLDG